MGFPAIRGTLDLYSVFVEALVDHLRLGTAIRRHSKVRLIVCSGIQTPAFRKGTTWCDPTVEMEYSKHVLGIERFVSITRAVQRLAPLMEARCIP